MAKTRTSQTIPIQLAVAEQDLKLAMAARAQAAYQAAIDTPGAAEELVAIEAEVAACHLRIDRLNAAATVAVQVVTAADVEAEKVAQAERIKRVAKLNEDIAKVSAQLVEQLTDLYEPLVRLEGACRERRTVVWQAVASPFDSMDLAHRRMGVQFKRRTDNTSETSLLLAAIRASGLGTVGPKLSPWVEFDLGRAGSPEPLLDSMPAKAQALLDLIAEADVVAHAPPKTYDEPVDEPTDESTIEETSHE